MLAHEFYVLINIVFIIIFSHFTVSLFLKDFTGFISNSELIYHYIKMRFLSPLKAF